MREGKMNERSNGAMNSKKEGIAHDGYEPYNNSY